MLGHFPTLYPDELLYSGIARFAERMDYPALRAIMQDLFGFPREHPHLLLTKKIDLLASRLPGRYPLDTESILRQHTLLPYYAPFLDIRTADLAQQCLRGARSVKSLFGRLQVFGHITHQVSKLRYCPECVEADREWHGETYWHRLHQLPGVAVCPRHHCFLEPSGVQTGKRISAFSTAESVVTLTVSRRLDKDQPESELLLQIAQAAQWLLNQGRIEGGLEGVRARYLHALIERGWATRMHIISEASALMRFFCQIYSPAFLRKLGIEVKTNHYHWPLDLVRKTPNTQNTDPLKHILLIVCLGYSAEVFFTLPDKQLPFGEGPWPCLNPVCTHYKQDVIPVCQIESAQGFSIRNVVRGTFRCPTCQFSYTRCGPDKLPEDKWRANKYPTVGPLWEARLVQMWPDPSISIKQMTQVLGMWERAIKSRAHQLGLPFPRTCNGWQYPRTTHWKTRPKKQMGLNLQRRAQYRSEWLEARLKHPELSRSEICRKLRRQYSWLRLYDGQWLSTHLPPKKLRQYRSRRLGYWSRRDREVAQTVRVKAVEMLVPPAKPMQMTAHALLTAAGAVLAYRHLPQMPKTAQALANVVESPEACRARRVHWAAAESRKNQRYPTKSQLLKKAGGQWNKGLHPLVQTAVEEEMKAFEREQLGCNLLT